MVLASNPKTHIAIVSYAARFLYGPRLPGFGSLASTSATISSTDHSLSVIPAAIAGGIDAGRAMALSGAPWRVGKPRMMPDQCLQTRSPRSGLGISPIQASPNLP